MPTTLLATRFEEWVKELADLVDGYLYDQGASGSEELSFVETDEQHALARMTFCGGALEAELFACEFEVSAQVKGSGPSFRFETPIFRDDPAGRVAVSVAACERRYLPTSR